MYVHMYVTVRVYLGEGQAGICLLLEKDCLPWMGKDIHSLNIEIDNYV